MFTDLPPSVCVDGPGSTAALAASCTDASAMARERLNRERSAWNDVLSRAGQPFTKSNKFASKLDDVLCRFVFSDAQTVDIPDLESIERKWLHLRSESIGLKSCTHTGTLRLTKPQGWTLPANPVPVKAPIKAAKTWKAIKAEKAKKMALWTTTCEGCSCNLDAYNALYHYSGMGPMCEDCIDADEELYGLKWEAKADFWR